MSIDHLIQVFGLFPGAFILCFVSGLIPFLNSEIFVLALAALTDKPGALMTIATLGALGQILAMMLLYASGSGFLNVGFLQPKNPQRLEKLTRLRERMTRYRGSAYSVLFIAASTGLPPVFMVSVVCGILRVNLSRFILIAFSARILRFAILVWFPFWIKNLFS